MLKIALCKAAGWQAGDSLIGFVIMIRPLLKERSRLHTLWFIKGYKRDRKKFSRTLSAARHAIRSAKNAWFQV